MDRRVTVAEWRKLGENFSLCLFCFIIIIILVVVVGLLFMREGVYKYS